MTFFSRDNEAGPAINAALPSLTAATTGSEQAVMYGSAPVPAVAPPAARKASFFDKKVKTKELMQFSRQMAAFVRSGVPILDGLALLQEDVTNPTLLRTLAGIASALQNGESFSSALDAYPKVFPLSYRAMVRSAELTGQLDTVLERVGAYLERDVEAKGKIKSASIYPALVAVLAFGVTILLTTFVLPKFTVFFASFHAKLPWATRALINTSNFLTHWGLVLIAILVVLVAVFVWMLRRPRTRHWLDRRVLRLPVFGPLLRYALVERFCRILGSMTEAGIPLAEAMAVAGKAMNNLYVANILDVAREGMMRGDGVARSLGATTLFPAVATQMLRVGEDTGSLDEQLGMAAHYYEREVDDRLKRLTSLFEPLILIAVGLVVGFVAIALVSAMYGIFKQTGSVK
ncbi:MAG: type pilus assembly protein PilC [Frankiales bacterium]|jgi:type IV pilus assembly protein PilC|nr:type pilus assembly protein PilC [Frankiales bacterium]